MSPPLSVKRSVAARVATYVSAVLLMLLLVRRYARQGGPYFEMPETVEEHMSPIKPLSRDAIVLSRRAEPLMPRGTSVTVIAPVLAPNYDATHYLAASGLLPHHHVVAPPVELSQPDFVIAIGEPDPREGYRLLAEFPEGRLYAKVK